MIEMKPDNISPPALHRAFSVAGFMVVLSAVIIGYVRWSTPSVKPPSLEVYDRYDPASVRDALRPESVKNYQDHILVHGSRYIGQPGHQATQQLIREKYIQAGLDVIEQRVNTVAPQTIRREILDLDGNLLADVEVYPFLPNQFTPVSTPDEGLTGVLLHVTDEILTSRQSFKDCIAVVDVANPPKALGLDFRNYAAHGFAALILSHHDGLEAIEWTRGTLDWMTINVPVNYPRLAATADIFEYIGEEVRLKVQSKYTNVDNVNFIGFMPASGNLDKPSSEVVVITTQYDACSWLPDLAHGTGQSLSLATQLALLEGLGPQQNQLKRDVIFVATGAQAMGQAGMQRLLSILGTNHELDDAQAHQRKLLEKHKQKLQDTRLILKVFTDQGFFKDVSATETAWSALSKPIQKFADKQIRYVLNNLLFDLKEKRLQAKLDFLRVNENIDSPEYQKFLAAQCEYESVLMILGYKLSKIVGQAEDIVEVYDIRSRCVARFNDLAAYHQEQYARAETAIEINRRFQKYNQIIFITPHLTPAVTGNEVLDGEAVAMFMGYSQSGKDYHTSLGPSVNDLVAVAANRAILENDFRFESLRYRHMRLMDAAIDKTTIDSSIWLAAGYPAFALINTNRFASYQHFASPTDVPRLRDLSTVSSSLQVMGETVLSLVYGNGRFELTPMNNPKMFGGKVFVGGMGRSIVPNYPLVDALIGFKCKHEHNSYGRYEQAFLWTDPYGRYEFPFNFASRSMIPEDDQKEKTSGYSPVAVGYHNNGQIAYIRDEGSGGQRTYQSMGLAWKDASAVNIVVFRATPVTVIDLINPQSLKNFNAVTLLERDGLIAVKKFAIFKKDCLTRFIEPDQYFYVALKAGASGNELVHVTRAFMLGIDSEFQPGANSTREIDGPGYLAADAEFIQDVPLQITRSMAWLNGKRLAQQNRHAMADQRTNDYHRKSEEMLQAAEQYQLAEHERTLRANDSATYQMLNHPVLRESIAEAVLSILWYLCLLVPFTFFFEKLLFAYPDIRKQLTAHLVIFLVAFILLRLLHPAFEMIRSSLMILLGFIIVLISSGITILFSGKFQENLEDLKASQGSVAAAEVNILGVVGTAFMLGLNNMHRRKVRTGLTCATLALITFAMICFTTTQNDLVDSEFAIGKAPYQGLLVKDQKLEIIEDGELVAVRRKYNHRFEVAPRSMVLGRRNKKNEVLIPHLKVEYVNDGITRSWQPKSVMTFQSNEPLASMIQFTTKNKWFNSDNSDQPVGALPDIMIPAPMAEALGIAAQHVDAGQITVRFNGKPYRVLSIFEPQSVRKLRDLDGKDILPFDAESMRDIQVDELQRIWAVEPYTRIDPSEIVFTETIAGLPLGEDILERRTSVAVWLRDKHTDQELPYKEARAEADSYLEQSGRLTYYGLGGVAYQGQQTRQRNIAGVLDMLIPLIIAALTVLNTIRGSVYERRSEIYVYNAVGIAPRYVFFMFFAEAFVYAVVGTVLGYFLSQGTGRILTELDWTGGLNMTFTSYSTVLASLAIMAAVFASTLFPALNAKEIAAPAEESGWEIPEPDGDVLDITLPFTYGPRDRLAVLEFFNRFFLNYGEGSSGAFFCDTPSMTVADQLDPLNDDGHIPQLQVTVWLKPYDLGVSQKLVIALPTDPQTHEFIAQLSLTRLSGTRKAWERLNIRFLTRVRKHFLHWRAVGVNERSAMYEQACREMREQLRLQGVHHAS